MRKHFFTLALLALTALTYGQIVITNNDVAPVGTTIYMATDTVPADEIVPGDAGADKSWDFSGLVDHLIDTMGLVMPASTPYADEFPGSNYALTFSNAEDTSNFFSYMIRNSDKMSSIGLVGETPEGMFIWKVSPENIIHDFPVAYGDSYPENYTEVAVFSSPQPGADSVRLKNTVTKQTNVDAWGMLTIPMGTFDVLRIRADEVSTDSVFVLIAGNWLFISRSQDSTASYSWWTNDVTVGFELCNIMVNKSNGEVTDVSFLLGTTVGITEQAVVESKAYPNPVTDVLSIEFDETLSGELLLMNQLGQLVLSEKIVAQKHIQLNLSGLPAGMYLYSLNNSAGELIGSGKLVKR
ncbi:MAG: T9SS type A sorting domain-containing protein [Bacteroidales bacterium]|nr:T9SS type A sorting domain-containing protein [Bacteroidales bacterium]